jgi:hypothetical protein
MKMIYKTTKVMIRAVIYFMGFIALSHTAAAQANAEFENRTVDFGTVVEGSICKHSYKFKNTGNKPLEISNVSVTCGCTVPRWSHTPIMPGDTSSIYIEFNTFNKMGPQAKGVNLTTNCAEPMIGLIIMANIIPDSNFVQVIDSVTYKPLRLVDQKSYFQVILPAKSLAKKGFKGDAYDLEKMIKFIFSTQDKAVTETLWYTTNSDFVIVNTYIPENKIAVAKILKKELSKKKKVKAWQKKSSK